MFSTIELAQIREKNMTPEDVTQQFSQLQRGNIFITLDRAATINDGIQRFTKATSKKYIDYFEKQLGDKKIVKFVPASGSASRMFKTLFNFVETCGETEEEYANLLKDISQGSVLFFLQNIKKLPFYSDLNEVAHKSGLAIEKLIEKKNYKELIRLILNKKGLNLGFLPKALIKFHTYPDLVRTAFDEHLVEASLYARNQDDTARLHFTILPQHKEFFEKHLAKNQSFFEEKYTIKLTIDFSIQKPSTDTIAINENGNLLKDDEDKILFRPGGHGSLIENLNDLDADIIFIKNIDNVSPDRLKTIAIPYKKMMAGLLLAFQGKAHCYLSDLENNNVTKQKLEEISDFIQKYLYLAVKPEKSALKNILDRPIRVCGMVPNKEEPGGGPFWVKDSQQQVSLQIVEGPQINKHDSPQAKILASATHFNPVDIVCSTKNYAGKKFDLSRFVDKNTSFITDKSFKGRKLTSIEHPGLWNGSMAYWNTIFIEVPSDTFNPVKTVSDLLLPSHLC